MIRTVPNSTATRQLISFGVFRPDICLRPYFSVPMHRYIYDLLRACGFRRTIWQYIFDGQIAGLVKPGVNDIHIRFYLDRLFAEMEISRAYVSHFYGPTYNASEIILSILKPHLSEDQFLWLQGSLNSESTRIDEAMMPVFEEGSFTRKPFEDISQSRGRDPLSRLMRWCLRLEWRAAGLSTVAVLTFPLYFALPLPILIASCFSSVAIVYLAAPEVPKA